MNNACGVSQIQMMYVHNLNKMPKVQLTYLSVEVDGTSVGGAQNVAFFVSDH